MKRTARARVVFLHQAGERVQGVEQKVRVDLPAQRVEAGHGGFLFQALGAHRGLAPAQQKRARLCMNSEIITVITSGATSCASILCRTE